MTAAPVWEAGEKTHRDENFPVASHLVSKRHRPVILAFYRFARAADDVADHPELSESEKRSVSWISSRTSLLGKNDDIADALPLRAVIAERGLSPKHGQDLLVAFRMDATKRRYADWDDLINYCAYSAMPVGRFVLDVHGESRATWPANDALCAALQIINHLQDCGADYRRLDRVYIPLDRLTARNIPVEALAAPKASPELLKTIRELAARTERIPRRRRSVERHTGSSLEPGSGRHRAAGAQTCSNVAGAGSFKPARAFNKVGFCIQLNRSSQPRPWAAFFRAG